MTGREVEFLILIPLIPFLGFLFNGFNSVVLKNRFDKKVISYTGTFPILISFGISLFAFYKIVSLPVSDRLLTQNVFRWLTSGNLAIDCSLMADPLTSIMLLVITGIGSLIHIYSIGYMHEDKGFSRFFAYLNLFIFFMCFLVLGDNLLMLFLGWEGVGLCSYLLIGFWFENQAFAQAGKKAFVTNRVGDFAFIIGIISLLLLCGTSKFQEINTFFISNGSNFLIAANLIAILLFIGATGKSAQIPLYIWLPDAMAGPTPVSALIHAATMVTAGIYMIARLNGLFITAEYALQAILYIGCATAFFAALLGVVQRDIKKILAYSTISQLGFMFMALGAGAFGIGIFHLFCHAFYKACLFLGAGAVIHTLHHEQDVMKMGGLNKLLPLTFKTFLAGSLALAGLPPFSGFFSKDEILWKTFSEGRGSVIVYFFALITAFLTALYIFRLIYLAFYGTSRMEHEVQHHAHDPSKTMLIPLFILAFFSVIAGFFGLPGIFGNIFFNFPNLLETFLSPVFNFKAEAPVHHFSHAFEFSFMVFNISVALLGWYFAKTLFKAGKDSLKENLQSFKAVSSLLENKFYVEEIYSYLIYKPLLKVSRDFLWKIADTIIIDGFVNFSARFIRGVANIKSFLQSGNTQYYAFLLLAGVFILICYLNLF